MTKEEYLAKMKANVEEKEREREERYRRKQENYASQAITRIIERIEKADPQQTYVVGEEETKWLSDSEIFNKKLYELRKKYDFLDIHINTKKYLGSPNEIRSVSWHVKEDGE